MKLCWKPAFTRCLTMTLYCTLKWFVADDGCKSCSCSVLHLTAALRRTEGAFPFNLNGIAYHPCDPALWWLHHTGRVGLRGIDSNLVERTSYLTDHSVRLCACRAFYPAAVDSASSQAASPQTIKVTTVIRNSTSLNFLRMLSLSGIKSLLQNQTVNILCIGPI